MFAFKYTPPKKNIADCDAAGSLPMSWFSVLFAEGGTHLLAATRPRVTPKGEYLSRIDPSAWKKEPCYWNMLHFSLIEMSYVKNKSPIMISQND